MTNPAIKRRTPTTTEYRTHWAVWAESMAWISATTPQSQNGALQTIGSDLGIFTHLTWTHFFTSPPRIFVLHIHFFSPRLLLDFGAFNQVIGYWAVGGYRELSYANTLWATPSGCFAFSILFARTHTLTDARTQRQLLSHAHRTNFYPLCSSVFTGNFRCFERGEMCNLCYFC